MSSLNSSESDYAPLGEDTSDVWKENGGAGCLGCCLGSFVVFCIPCFCKKKEKYEMNGEKQKQKSFVRGFFIGFALIITIILVILVIAFATDLIHAGCHIKISFQDSCDDVRDEISNRVNGQWATWHDPHNNGTYTFKKNSSHTDWMLTRLTGDGKYTDEIWFTFKDGVQYDSEPDSDSLGLLSLPLCHVTARSHSIAFSIKDAGTNYCNLHDLYCSDPDCYPFEFLDYVETVGSCSSPYSNSRCYQV